MKPIFYIKWQMCNKIMKKQEKHYEVSMINENVRVRPVELKNEKELHKNYAYGVAKFQDVLKRGLC